MNTTKKIVLAEDNSADVKLAKIALRGFPKWIQLEHVGDGKGLINYLEKANPEEIAFILLDLNMPKVSGMEFLKLRKEKANWINIPVVVFTCSFDYQDIQKCYNLGANTYVNKPVELEEYEQTFQALVRFWCKVPIKVNSALGSK